MNKFILHIALYLFSTAYLYAQSEQKYSAVNPALFLYTTDDVYIKPLTKYNNGTNIIKPNPTQYPWESYLENGMPNILRDENGNLSIYISSWVSYSQTPPSKMGVMVYTNNTSDITNWKRPNAGLYWYNPNGVSGDDKISSVYSSGYKETNIVAVDVESFGIYDDYETTTKPIKLIYLPQRESGNKILSGYEMDRTFNGLGILQDFADMKNDRKMKQKNFTFKFINGDTHMNYFKRNGSYYFVSRLNGKRSTLLGGETLPFSPDPRKRYRRETVTEIGPQLTSKNVDFTIALDMSTTQWEPYSLQPVRLPDFENDIWWGLVTMFGTEGDEAVQYKQRTELAISNDGLNWKYLKPGIPFLDNGTNPQSDDYGCINIGKPIGNTHFSSNPSDLYYFYAASNVRHVAGRNPGISLATGKYGKMAGLKVGNTEKQFFSMEPTSYPIVAVDNIVQLSLYDAFREGSSFCPYILADITDDPRGKMLTQLNSYVAVLMYSYSQNGEHGKGKFLGGTLGSSLKDTHSISDNYESVGFISQGQDGSGKYFLLEYLREYSQSHPTEIVSIKEFPKIPVVIQTSIKNAILYGVKFNKGVGATQASIDLTNPSRFEGGNIWTYSPTSSSSSHTKDFSNDIRLPNQKVVVDKSMGTIAVKMTPVASNSVQTILRIYGDNENNLAFYYDPSGNIKYEMQKDGVSFADIIISPPTGKTFANKEVIMTFETVKKNERKYASTFPEESAILRVSCPSLGSENEMQQNILWNWKHQTGNITPADSANARGFAYLEFSSFVAGMNKITVGAKNTDNVDLFKGMIHKVQIANKLPTGQNDFWDSSVLQSTVLTDDSNKSKVNITNN